MDLKRYEAAKFEVARWLREVATDLGDASPAVRETLQDIFVRLAEDRFDLAFAGRFSRGKSSLMNALLGAPHLPTGIVPVTSVITAVTYGSREEVVLRHQGHRLESRIPLDALSEHISQKHNPGNTRGIREAEVRLPIEMLRRGFRLVDTPGLASLIAANTATTQAFLGQADAIVVVTSYESPLSQEEMRIVDVAIGSALRTFLVVNKADLVPSDEKHRVLEYVRTSLEAAFGGKAPAVFSVSARDALPARISADSVMRDASGIQELEAAILSFVTEERNVEFLARMRKRLLGLARELKPADALRRTAELEAIFAAMAAPGVPTTAASSPQDTYAGRDVLPSMASCEICDRAVHAVFDFLRSYQSVLSTSAAARAAHAERGGLCPLHTWQYAALASPYGICTGYTESLARVQSMLERLARGPKEDVPASIDDASHTDACVVCAICESAELAAIKSIVDRISQFGPESVSPVCMPHLGKLLAAVPDAALRGALLARETSLVERIRENMSRYATKHDALRRFLATEEEERAAETAIALIAGHRTLSAASRS